MDNEDKRVGARHQATPHPVGGGGYLDICSVLGSIDNVFDKKKKLNLL